MAQPLTDVVYVQRFELPSPMAHAIQIVSTARAMAEQGVRVHLFVHTLHRRHPADVVQQDMGWVSPDNLLWHRIPSRHKGVAGLIYRADLLRQLTTRGRVIFYARQRRQTLQLLALRHLVRFAAPICYAFHNLEHVLLQERGEQQQAARVRRQEQRLVTRSDGLVAISTPLADDLQAVFHPTIPLAVIPDGVELQHFHAIGQPQFAPGQLRLLYVGSLHQHKGIDTLLEAIALLPARFHLDVGGGYPPEALARLCQYVQESPSLATRVHCTGSVPPANVPEYFRHADLVILPASTTARSERYTSPLKLFEAMASGVPIVAAPVPSLSSVLADGQTAFLAASSAPRDLAHAIMHAASSPARALTLARAAMDASAVYSWQQRAQQILRFLAQPRSPSNYAASCSYTN